MPIASASSCFVKNGEFVTRTIAGETIVVPVRGRAGDLEAIYNLNEVGGFIWTLLDRRTSLRQIADAVCAEFDVPLEQAVEDATQFLSELEHAGVVQVSMEGQ